MAMPGKVVRRARREGQQKVCEGDFSRERNRRAPRRRPRGHHPHAATEPGGDLKEAFASATKRHKSLKKVEWKQNARRENTRTRRAKSFLGFVDARGFGFVSLAPSRGNSNDGFRREKETARSEERAGEFLAEARRGV